MKNEEKAVNDEAVNQTAEVNQSKDTEKTRASVTGLQSDKPVDQSRGINFWWGVLSFFVPVAGIVLQIVWWKDRHSNAVACMVGWIIGLVAPVVCWILCVWLLLLFAL